MPKQNLRDLTTLTARELFDISSKLNISPEKLQEVLFECHKQILYCLQENVYVNAGLPLFNAFRDLVQQIKGSEIAGIDAAVTILMTLLKNPVIGTDTLIPSITVPFPSLVPSLANPSAPPLEDIAGGSIATAGLKAGIAQIALEGLDTLASRAKPKWAIPFRILGALARIIIPRAVTIPIAIAAKTIAGPILSGLEENKKEAIIKSITNIIVGVGGQTALALQEKVFSRNSIIFYSTFFIAGIFALFTSSVGKQYVVDKNGQTSYQECCAINYFALLNFQVPTPNRVISIFVRLIYMYHVNVITGYIFNVVGLILSKLGGIPI